MRVICFVVCTAAPSSAKLIQNRMRWKNSPQTGYVGSLEGGNGNRFDVTVSALEERNDISRNKKDVRFLENLVQFSGCRWKHLGSSTRSI